MSQSTTEEPGLRAWLTAKFLDLRERQGARYIVVGGSTYVVELIVIVVALHFGMSAVWSVGISFFVGLIVSFVLQKLITFGDRRTRPKILLPQIITFSLLVAFNFGFTEFATYLLQHDMPLVVIRTLVIGITTIWNYYLYRTRIFRIPVVD
jgi:putative flippase GtrA